MPERATICVHGHVVRASALPHHELYFDGYVSNLSEIAAQLNLPDKPGNQRATMGIISAACQKWGAAVSQNLTGEYALVFVDKLSQTAILAHDELGLRNLFYHVADEQISISFFIEDHPKSKHPDGFNIEYFSEYLYFSDIRTHNTPYKNLVRLLPGQSAIWGNGSVQTQDCWTLDSVEVMQGRTTEDYAEELKCLLAEAVTLTLPASGKTWCELSGGLDSSTVLALAHRCPGANIEAISYTYPQSEQADERDWIKLMLDACPVPAYMLDGDARLSFSELPTERRGEPSNGMIHAARDRAYAEMLIEHKVDTVLTGMGGDDVLFGYMPRPYFLADLAKRGALPELLSSLKGWSQTAYPSRSGFYWLWRGALQPLFGDPYLDARPNCPLPWLTKKVGSLAIETRNQMRSAAPDCGSIAQNRYLGGVLTGARVVSNWLLPRRMPAEIRNPLMHRPLVAFMCGLPQSEQTDGRQTRLLQRRALAGILPDAVLHRKTKPIFDQAVFRGLERSEHWFQTSGMLETLVDHGLIDTAQWRDSVARARLGFVASYRHFLAMATLEAWLHTASGSHGNQSRAKNWGDVSARGKF
jgi:asparagine synthase (glutamine-hydrolysing)